MKYDSYREEKNRRDLLNKLKEQYEPGPMRPQLYELLAIHGIRMPVPSYQWMYYAGMGDTALIKAKPEEERAIKHLIRQGSIVPTLAEDFEFGAKTIRRLKHFDDVHFGLDANASAIIYEFSGSPGQPDPIIRPDQMHDAAIEQLRFRIKYNRAKIDEDPILLQHGPVVWPIHTDKEVIALRGRQRAYGERADFAMQ